VRARELAAKKMKQETKEERGWRRLGACSGRTWCIDAIGVRAQTLV
jgi:hypothetical protein